MATDSPMQLSMIGLGRMGANLTRRLMHDGHHVVVYDVNADAVKGLEAEGATGSHTLADFVNALELFKIGYSWGGVASLAVAYDFTGFKGRPDYGHRIVRLHIGLEDRNDLIADLEQALKKLS